MNEGAAWMVDRLLRKNVAYRQYVVTFPSPLAVGLCFREKLQNAVVRLCVRVLFEHQRARAEPTASSTPTASNASTAATDPTAAGRLHPGAIVWLQRFSDGAGCFFHLHILAPDGVYRDFPDRLGVRFEAQPPPTQAEVQRLCETIARRVSKLVLRHASTQPDDPLLRRCAEQPAVSVRTKVAAPTSRPKRPQLLGQKDGFTVHAATFVRPHDDAGLERLCRYLQRPALPKGRIERTVDGRVSFELKRPRHGTTRLLFEPLAFIARMAALIPRPGSNQIRFFGVSASAAPLRRFVLPSPPEATPARPVAPERPRRMLHRQMGPSNTQGWPRPSL